MSKFATFIPVDVASVQKLLPPGHHLAAVRYDAEASAIVLDWEHDDFRTRFTYAVEFPLEALEKKRPPRGVEYSRRRAKEKPARAGSFLSPDGIRTIAEDV